MLLFWPTKNTKQLRQSKLVMQVFWEDQQNVHSLLTEMMKTSDSTKATVDREVKETKTSMLSKGRE